MARETKAEKLLNARIESCYSKGCSGVQINIMDISKVFAFGKACVSKDPIINDEALTVCIRAFVDTIRCN